MKVKELIEKLKKMDQELSVHLSVDNGDDLDYHTECEFVHSALLDEEWGPIDEDLWEEDEDTEGMEKVVRLG